MNISDLLDKHFEGNKASLASVIGVSRQAVNQWDGDERLKPEYVIPVCRFLQWSVTPHQLRDDIYPNMFDGVPEEVRIAA